MLTEDLDIFFSGPDAVDVVSGDSSFKALLDQPDETVGQFSISTEYVLTAKTSDVSGISEGAALTIGSDSYTVRQVRKIDDGAVSKMLLSKD